MKIEGKGLGIVASRNIKQGEIIIKEKAALILPLKCKNKVLQRILFVPFLEFI